MPRGRSNAYSDRVRDLMATSGLSYTQAHRALAGARTSAHSPQIIGVLGRHGEPFSIAVELAGFWALAGRRVLVVEEASTMDALVPAAAAQGGTARREDGETEVERIALGAGELAVMVLWSNPWRGASGLVEEAAEQARAEFDCIFLPGRAAKAVDACVAVVLREQIPQYVAWMEWEHGQLVRRERPYSPEQAAVLLRDRYRTQLITSDQYITAPLLGLLLAGPLPGTPGARDNERRMPREFRKAVYAEMAALHAPVLASVPHTWPDPVSVTGQGVKLGDGPLVTTAPQSAEARALQAAAQAVHRAVEHAAQAGTVRCVPARPR